MIALLFASLDPYQIFERAREVWASQRYPAVVSYLVDVQAGEPGKLEQRRYHEYWSASDNRVLVKPPVSDEQLANPYKPSPGVNFMGWNIGAPREGMGARDFIGAPVLAPNYSFGLYPYIPPSQIPSTQLVEQIRREYHDPAPNKIDTLAKQSGLKTIAIVTSSARAYRISLVGVETGQYGPAYHLSLQPLRDPLKYRLRDLWIDTSTFVTDRLRIGGNFTDAACENTPWMVRFQQIGGATYIAREDAEKPITGYHGAMYAQYSVSFGVPARGAMPPFAEMTSVSSPLAEP